MLSDSTMAPVKNKKKSSQRQVEHDARIEIIEAEWELLGVVKGEGHHYGVSHGAV